MFALPHLDHISEGPGVYIFRDAKKSILYVGKAKNLKKRLSQYFSPGSVRKQDMLSKADDVEFLVCQTEQEALVLESNFIKQHYPPFNRLLKWDNSYVYIKITNHAFPQILLTRYRSDDGATYIGPKNNTQDLKKLIHFLRQFLQFRTCKDVQFRQGELCNDYVFGLCKGRCVYAKMEAKAKTNANSSGMVAKVDEKYNQIIERAKRLWFDVGNV
jgi:excinuclease ABC subunit C